MALWGKKEKDTAIGGFTFTSTGNKIVTPSPADARAVLKAGDLIIVGTDTKLYRVVSVTATIVNVHLNCAAQAAVQSFKATPPKYLSDADLANVYFVDQTEAAVAANRAKGLTGPGWWYYVAGTGGRSGRKTAECLIPMRVSAATAGDREDTVTADS